MDETVKKDLMEEMVKYMNDLSDNNVKLIKENLKLSTEVTKLKSLLISNGIKIPEGL